MSLRTAIRPAFGRSPHRLGRDVRFGSAGIAVQFVAWAAPMSVPWVIYDNASSPVNILLALTVPLIGPAVATPLLTRVQRQRFAALLDVGITGPPRARRQLWYHLLAGPAVAFGGVLAWGFALVGVVATTVFLWRQQAGRLKFLPDATSAAYLTVGGCALLALAYWLIAALVRLDTRAATAFLGLSVRSSTRRSSSAAGLVSMAVNLGLAKATMDDLPEAARKVIDEAHREAKEAIEELSNLVRGLHPAVLDELGLDAALSGIAARAPLPVRLRVDVPERAAPTVEAVAYFVVSEALANIAKHARATRAGVGVVRAGDRPRVVVDDDGAGGADPARGSGLAGLAQRVGSVDGTFDISSPFGGPTVITVELPCAL
ncbi:sensor histidine kinase [Streptomyces malaysiensis]|uniref:sensor histidine kinase n=1 Tax=Streptomyces malaysiensis TaxID=92644 RepID=UPI00372338D2